MRRREFTSWEGAAFVVLIGATWIGTDLLAPRFQFIAVSVAILLGAFYVLAIERSRVAFVYVVIAAGLFAVVVYGGPREIPPPIDPKPYEEWQRQHADDPPGAMPEEHRKAVDRFLRQ